MVAAATDAVCCQSTLTNTNIDETNMIAREIWETGREGNGLCSPSSSSCQPGNVARRRRQTNARMMATILENGLSVRYHQAPKDGMAMPT
jgi:hypothetical protein